MFSIPSMLWAGYDKKVVEILNPNNSKKNHITIFNKGNSIFGGLPFLHFCNKYDICNQQEIASGCVYGKMNETATR